LKRTGANFLSHLSEKIIPMGESVREDVKAFIDYVISGFD
jgi:hypothetical protein